MVWASAYFFTVGKAVATIKTDDISLYVEEYAIKQRPLSVG